MNNNALIEKIKEPQILLSILYIMAVGIGMIFNHYKFVQFGINIFDYSDLTDFILAPFGDLNILLNSIFIFIGCAIFYKIDSILKIKKPKWYDYKLFQIINYTYISIIVTTLLFATLLIFNAKSYSISYFKNLEQEKNIFIKTKSNSYQGKYLGKTNNVLFIYINNKVQIFPITSNIEYYTFN